MSFWNKMFKASQKASPIHQIHLCNGSKINASVAARASAVWNNELTIAAGLDDTFYATVAIYKESANSFVAEQSITHPMIFLSSDAIRQAVESVPEIAEVKRFNKLSAAKEWISEGQLIETKTLKDQFIKEFL